jgi:diacylglycerol kinase (ATP)
MRALLVCSPSAGNDGPSQEDLLSVFRQHGIESSCCPITEAAFAEAGRDGTDVIIAVGGDGTVTSVLTQLPNRQIPVAVVPQGTANNIARSLGIHGSASQIAAGLWDARPKKIDIGVATGAWGRHRFVEGVGIGLLVQAMSVINESGKEGFDQLRSSRREFARQLAEADCHRLDVRADGQSLSGDYLIFEIMNTGFAGPILPLAPHADPGDGLLDIVYSTASRRREMLDWLNEGPEGAEPPVEIVRARRVEVEEAGPALRLGDSFSPTSSHVGRMTVELEPEKATILIPATMTDALSR